MPTLNERVARLEALLLGVIPAVPDRYLRLTRIRIVVAQAHGMTVKVLCSRCREKRFAEARFMAFHLSRKFTAATFDDIGKVYGCGKAKDHGTIIHGMRRCFELCQVDEDFKKRLETLERDLQSEFNAINQ